MIYTAPTDPTKEYESNQKIQLFSPTPTKFLSPRRRISLPTQRDTASNKSTSSFYIQKTHSFSPHSSYHPARTPYLHPRQIRSPQPASWSRNFQTLSFVEKAAVKPPQPISRVWHKDCTMPTPLGLERKPKNPRILACVRKCG